MKLMLPRLMMIKVGLLSTARRRGRVKDKMLLILKGRQSSKCPSCEEEEEEAVITKKGIKKNRQKYKKKRGKEVERLGFKTDQKVNKTMNIDLSYTALRNDVIFRINESSSDYRNQINQNHSR